MSRELKKIYMFFIITLVILIMVFPYIFLNINNSINYIKVKWTMILKEQKDIEVNIYSNRANIIIMFDDGWKSQYTVGYNYMNKKKMVGSISIITEMVDEIDYVSKGDLYTIQDSNWDILNHTYSHQNFKKINKQEQIREITRADKWLYKNGFINSSKTLIYPEGDHNLDTEEILNNLNYTSGRTTVEGFNTKRPTNLYNIKVKNILSHTNLNDVYDWIDYNIDNNLTLILLFHRLEDNANSFMKYEKENFYKIIDYIDEKRDNLNIINYSDWLQTIKL